LILHAGKRYKFNGGRARLREAVRHIPAKRQETLMINTCVKTAMSILLVGFVSVAITPARQAANSEGDSAGVKQAVADWIDAFNHHDAHAAAMLYSEDADLTNMNEVNYHGRPAIERLYQTIFATRLKNAHRTAVVKRIRFLTPSLAAVDCDWEMTGATDTSGAALPLRQGYLVLTMTKENGRWVMAQFHEPEFNLPVPAK
jgi:uncharacterized protein (TIGR02246 family)